MNKGKVKISITAILTVCMALMMNILSVSAHEIDNNGVIFLDNLEDIEHYNGADGTYAVLLEDGRCIRVTIKTTYLANSGISLYDTEYIQNKSYNYEYIINGDLDWSSEVSATFHYNNTYVWCTEGIAYHDFGDPSNSSISYSLNTYSSAKVTGVSKYQIKAQIKTPTGTYNISQYVGSDPSGQIYYDMSY